MSKKHGARAKRRKKNQKIPRSVFCPHCNMPAGSAENVLQSLATLLNMAEEGGPWTKIRFKHGAAFSESGVVVPPFKKQPWEAKMFNINALRKIAGISLPEPRPDDLDD